MWYRAPAKVEHIHERADPSLVDERSESRRPGVRRSQQTDGIGSCRRSHGSQPAVDRSQATDEEVVEAFDDLFTDRTCVLYDSWGSNQIDTICQRLMWMVRAHGITHAVLDHISILVSGNEGDDRKNLDIAATKLRSLCQETGLHLIVVSHLKRPDGRGHEDGGAVSLSQVRGSTAIAGLSDTVLGLQKDPENPDSDLRILRILKNRYTGETGFAGTLVYDRQTGRLLEEELALLEAEVEDEPETAEGENDESSK